MRPRDRGRFPVAPRRFPSPNPAPSSSPTHSLSLSPFLTCFLPTFFFSVQPLQESTSRGGLAGSPGPSRCVLYRINEMYFSNIHRSYEYRGTRKGDGYDSMQKNEGGLPGRRGGGGEERKKKKEKSEEKRRKPFRSDSAALTNPDEGPRRFPNGPLCVGCSVCGTSPPSSGDPAICKSVCLSLPVLPATIFYVKDKLLRKYITDITPKCGLVFIHPKRYVRDKYLV